MLPAAGAGDQGRGLSTSDDHIGISKGGVLRKQFTSSAPNMQGMALMDFSHLYENVSDTVHVPSITSEALNFLKAEVAWCVWGGGRLGFGVFIKS